MLTKDDLIDLIVAGLAKAEPAAGAWPAGPRGRRFLSEHEIKKRLTAGGGRLTLPRGVIVSPLAVDWLTLQGIEIVQE